MANPIDLIVTQDALKQVDALISKVIQAKEGLLDLGNAALGSSKNVSKISTPSGLTNNSTANAQINAEIKKHNAEIEKLHATIAKKAEQSRLAEIRLQQAREKAFDSFERNAKKEEALNRKNETAYQRIQNSVNALTKTYQDLAIRKQLGSTLTEKEEKQLVSLTGRISTYQKALLATDAQIGKNQRNVGNYASGYNALGNSINQLSREAPAFANSVNTGFMALSNNFPALFDAINGIRDKNKMLVAEGKPTVSVLKSIAGAIFSWQTLLSVGVTLLTLYGGKLVEFVGNAIKGKQAVQSLAENQKQLNNALAESSGSYAEQKVKIDVLYKSATDLNRSYKDRKRDVDELQQLYPFYFKNQTTETFLAGKATEQYNLLSKALIITAKARASEEILQKRESERLIIEQEQIGSIMKKYKDLARAKNENTTSTSVGVGGVSVVIGKEAIRKDIQKLRDESVQQRDKWAKEDAFFIAKIAEGNVIEQTLAPAVKDTTKAKKEKVEATKLEAVSTLELVKAQDTALEKLKMLKKALEQTRDETSKNSTEFQQFETSIKAVNESIDFLTKGIQPIKLDIKTPFVEAQKDIEALKEATDNWLQSFSSEFLQNSGLGSLETFFDGTFDKLLEGAETAEEKFAVHFNAIGESAQEVFNFIANASQQRFDNERKRIEDQQALAISYAGGSAVAIAKINEDAEKRKKAIDLREAKAKKRQAIVNIAIDTAQAIVSAVAKSPLTGGLPFSAIAAAIGAVQIGIVASQKIPEYFDGTDNHSGGLMLVNDGKGSNYQEKVILPNGKEIMPQGRNVLMDAPKGTKVLTHEQQLFEMMQSNGINMTANYTKSNGMTASQMDAVLGKHFSNIKTHNTTFDKNGFKSYIQNGSSRTIMNQNRVSGSGISV